MSKFSDATRRPARPSQPGPTGAHEIPRQFSSASQPASSSKVDAVKPTWLAEASPHISSGLLEKMWAAGGGMCDTLVKLVRQVDPVLAFGRFPAPAFK
ncbi:hypothetical protein FQN49_006051, partial [Arthroderma sp. PD_2]